MKCEACKYDDTKSSDIFTFGDWIRLYGDFTVKKQGDWTDYVIKVVVYVCPKCGTLKIKN